MSEFLDVEVYQRRTMNQAIKAMDPDDVDELYLYPAERYIEEFFHLKLDTNGYPYGWEGSMTATPRLKTEFDTDMARATQIVADAFAENPGQDKMFMALGRSATPASTPITARVQALLQRWQVIKANRFGR